MGNDKSISNEKAVESCACDSSRAMLEMAIWAASRFREGFDWCTIVQLLKNIEATRYLDC